MPRRKTKLLCQLELLEVRQLLSTIYVSSAATGSNDGSSWANAYTGLQQALSVATAGTTIEVGQGVYKPTTGTDRTATFQLKDGVDLQGGYEGTGQSNPGARDVSTYPTILSGDVGATGDNSDNSFHVVTGSGTDATAILDGFTVTAGNANGGLSPSSGGGVINVSGSPTLSNCTITDNTAYTWGGGISNISSASPILTDCMITNNIADHSYGGGIANTNSSSPVLTDCTISGNSAGRSGGGMFNSHSSPTLTNCAIAGNTGGGIVNTGSSSPTLTHCTINDNTDGGIVNSGSSSPTLTNCTEL